MKHLRLENVPGTIVHVRRVICATEAKKKDERIAGNVDPQ